MNDFVAQMRKRSGEPLHQDLVPYLEESELVGASLKHPLVYDIAHNAQLAWRCNDQYAAKRAALRKAMKEREYETVIWLHERPYRLEALHGIIRLLHNREYWNLVGMVWTDSENIWQNQGKWADILTSQRPGRRYVMDEDERAALAAMPNVMTVYRGLTSPRGTRAGFSWTLSREKAEWFSKRLIRGSEKPVVLEGVVNRNNVIAYFTGRGEDEIVVSPSDVLLPKEVTQNE